MKCTLCKEIKKESDFSWKNKSKNKRHTRCKKCISKKVKKHYTNNKDKYLRKAKINNKKYIQRNRKYVFNYLKNNSCVDCGESNPIVLDFDHIKDKSENLAVLKSSSGSLKKIKEEIEKCEVRCANCHRIKTAQSRDYYKDLL